eukprot:CAMPEP_0171225056 /NCGR_PEP_ID=MMETSP0790-20130122/36608_1 /TAXON_ID=2925 /ORGANISM="Alexandrium catenella, Strain OF101" /LENGTH=60 /DNA_ID=CAMNT_0011691073 /DNA_START=79 /DNA_END=257 /DNA_ORIENTATION=+
MARSFAMGCCRLVLALAAVPIAVILTVLMETPVVTELPQPEDAAAAAGAPPASSAPAGAA